MVAAVENLVGKARFVILTVDRKRDRGRKHRPCQPFASQCFPDTFVFQATGIPAHHYGIAAVKMIAVWAGQIADQDFAGVFVRRRAFRKAGKLLQNG